MKHVSSPPPPPLDLFLFYSPHNLNPTPLSSWNSFKVKVWNTLSDTDKINYIHSIVITFFQTLTFVKSKNNLLSLLVNLQIQMECGVESEAISLRVSPHQLCHKYSWTHSYTFITIFTEFQWIHFGYKMNFWILQHSMVFRPS